MKRNTKFENSDYSISYEANFEEVMRAVTANRHGAILIVDNDKHVVGVVSDGDIRRAILRGAIMKTPIKQAINYNVIVVASDDKKTLANPQSIFSKHPHINIFPVVDKKNRLIDVLVRN